MTVDRLVAAAAELGPVTLDARSVFDAHGFSDGELLAEWAGRAGLAPPRLVCRRALFVLAAPRIWKASSRARATIGLRYDTDLPNPAVHRGYPAPIADGSALDEVAVSAPGAEVAAALALGEAVAHDLLFWEAPYDDEPPGWLELGLATTQDRLLRTVEWARSHPDRWTPRLVQGPVAPRAPWVSRSYW